MRSWVEYHPRRACRTPFELPATCGIPLKIAAKVDRADVDYFNEEIRPLLDQPGIEFIGEISDAEKSEFLSGAVGLLTLIDWPEPFGLVMIEAMACGTPVIAYPRGAVPEIIEDGVNGFIVADEEEAVVRGRQAGPAIACRRSCALRGTLYVAADGGRLPAYLCQVDRHGAGTPQSEGHAQPLVATSAR